MCEHGGHACKTREASGSVFFVYMMAVVARTFIYTPNINGVRLSSATHVHTTHTRVCGLNTRRALRFRR